MRLEVMTCTRRSAETAALGSSQSAKPSPVDSRSERLAIGVREPSVDQRIVVPLKLTGQRSLGAWPHRSHVLTIDRRVASPVSDAARNLVARDAPRHPDGAEPVRQDHVLVLQQGRVRLVYRRGR